MNSAAPQTRTATGMTWLRRIVGLVVVVACVVFLIRFPVGASLKALTSASGWLVAAAVLTRVFVVAARAERTRAMLQQELHVGRLKILRYVVCRSAGDNLLTGWSGIGVYTYLLVRDGGAKLSSTLGALALEKYLDFAAVTCLLAVTVHWKLLPLGWSEPSFWVFLILVLGSLPIALALGRYRAGSRLGKLLAPGARAFGPLKQGAWILLLTASVWLFDCLGLALAMGATGLVLSPLKVLMLTAVGLLAFIVPGVPAGAGTVEAGMMTALRLLGIDETQALAATLLYHAVQVVPETLAGVLSLKGLGLGRRPPPPLAADNSSDKSTAQIEAS